MTAMAAPSLPRRMWEATERLHASFYLAPEPRETASAAGLKGFWMTYFASRAAPMGAVGAATVESVFFYFSPARVRRAIPAAWELASPSAVLDARYEGVDRVLHRLYGDDLHHPSFAAALQAVRRAVDGCQHVGRPLFAAWADLPWPEDAHLALWHGCTLLREHRSGGHVMALALAGLDGCEAVVSHVAVDEAPQDWIEGEAGWTAEEAAAAILRLQERGWVDEHGRATTAGRDGRREVEEVTDRLDGAPWRALGEDGCTRLTDELRPLLALLPADDQLDWREHYGPN